MNRPTRFDLALRVALLLIFVLAVEWPGEPLVMPGSPQTVSDQQPQSWRAHPPHR